MQQHSKLVLGFTAIVLSGTLAFGAVASAAGSGDGDGDGRPQLTTEEKCEKSVELEAKATERLEKISERTAALQTKRAEAEAAGDTAKVERLDRRLEVLAKVAERIQQRMTKLETWVAANCAA